MLVGDHGQFGSALEAEGLGPITVIEDAQG